MYIRRRLDSPKGVSDYWNFGVPFITTKGGGPYVELFLFRPWMEWKSKT